MSIVSKNIENKRISLGISKAEMSIKLGISSQLYGLYERGERTPKNDFHLKWKQLFSEDLNIEPNETFHEKLNKKKLEPKEIPVMGGFTNLSIIEIHNDDFYDKHKIVGTLSQDLFPGCDHAEKAKGDSMYPLIMNNALLVGKRCSSEGIVFGEKYIIKTKSGIDTTKFVHPKKEDGKIVKGYIVLIAHNKHIPEQDISIDDIVFACRVNWIINPT